MSHLYEVLARRVDKWRADGYPAADFPAIGEVFEWARDPDTGALRYLRRPQLRALETYWYLRLIEKTPHVFDLYQRLFPEPPDLLDALSLRSPEIGRLVAGRPLEVLWDRIRGDDGFVRKHDLDPDGAGRAIAHRPIALDMKAT